MSSPRVVWVIKGLARGGAERLVTTMAPRVRDEGFDLQVVYVTPSADGFVPDLRAADVAVQCVGRRGDGPSAWPLRLRRHLDATQPAIIHTHSPLPAALARLVAPRGAALVHTEHNLWDAYRFPTLAANALTLARNSLIYAVSDGVHASMQRPWWSRIGAAPTPSVLLHGVDPGGIPHGTGARATARRALGVPDEQLVIGHVANLSAKKNQSALLRAFASLSDLDPVLIIAGDGPLRGELEQLATSLGVQPSVRFLGSREDVVSLLPGFDVFTLSSTYEGLPISLLEAMAAGVACVSTAVGGIPEAARDGIDAVLVPPADEPALAHGLRTVLNEPARRAELGAAGRARVEAMFSIDRAIERTCSDYRLLLDGAQ